MPLYKKIAGIDNVKVDWKPCWKKNNLNDVMAYLQAGRERELFFGTTLSGPHKDMYYFECGGTEFSRKASTGQRRLLALLLRVAQASCFKEASGKNPVLLLDDVMLELDGEKRVLFLQSLPEYEQAFFTFLPEEPFSRYKKEDTLIYRVEQGCLSRQTPQE
jgi:DNA replication and repair protein RecF